MVLNVMHKVAVSSLGLFAILTSAGCSSTSSPVETGRSPVVVGDAGQVPVEDGEESGNSVAPPSSNEPSSDEPPVGEGGFWTLVRSKDSLREHTEEWNYDDAGRLVKARVIQIRRDFEPYYAVDITLTYDGDKITSVNDPLPDDLSELTYEYELQEGRVVEYRSTHAGMPNDSKSFTYDAEGRLIGSTDNDPGDDDTFVLERREDGEPHQLLWNGEVSCVYSWRHVWLNTTCYTDGVATQIYEADASERLARLTFDGSTTVTYTYDDAGRLTTQTSGPSVYEYTYASDGRLVESSGPGYQESRIYDDLGLLREVRWVDGSSTTTTTFAYERVSASEVIETETAPDRTVVRTYKRLPHAPTGEPQLPSVWTILHMDQPNVYRAPTDYSKVP